MNLSQDITIGQIESEIKLLQNQLDNKIEEYENAVRKLEELVKILNKRYLSKTEKILDEL
ncbi:relaxase [Streptococcus mitis]|uniref:Relaxase n=1 Tax=Streptococcus mitis TaxID=28037 RepID=A0A150NJY9_STRMT|nr:relaxase [Streptococcus mitis]